MSRVLQIIRQLSFAITECFLRTLAEWEYRVFYHHAPRFFRNLYFRLMRVKHGKVYAIGEKFFLRYPGNLTLGNGCGIGSFARIWNYQMVEIGDDFLAAGGLTINTGGHDPVTMDSLGGPVKIGDRVWCGQNVTILAGVSIGNDVAIAACSLINKDVPSGTIVGGVPAKEIRKLERAPENFVRWADKF